MKLTKILALVLAVAMVMAMSATAFAADGTGEATKESNTITIPKAIVITNPDSAQKVYGPTVTYSYTATAGAADAVITRYADDGTTVLATTKTKAGITTEGALTISDVVYTTSATQNAVGANGVAIKKNISIIVDPTKFVATGAGVYRYILTESVATGTGTDAEKLTAIGMTRVADYSPARTLDIYLQNDGNGGLKVAGYVVSSSTTGDISKTGDRNVDGKNGGFVPGEITDPDTTEGEVVLTGEAVEASTDWYHTFNVELKKTVSGNAGDKKLAFDFTETVSNNGYQFFADKDVQTPTTAIAATGALDVDLKDGETLYIAGLNAKATVAYTETNNAPEQYKVTITGNNGTADTELQAQTAKNHNETSTVAATAITNYSSSATAKASITESNMKKVTFDNYLDQISPTGLVLRFAPYFAMVAAGAALFIILLAKKRKNQEDA